MRIKVSTKLDFITGLAVLEFFIVSGISVYAGNMQQAESLFPQLKELSRQIAVLLGDIRREFKNDQTRLA